MATGNESRIDSVAVRMKDVPLSILDNETRKKIKKMFDALEEGCRLRKELFDGGIHVKFYPHAGLITTAGGIRTDLTIREITLEPPAKVIKSENRD